MSGGVVRGWRSVPGERAGCGEFAGTAARGAGGAGGAARGRAGPELALRAAEALPESREELDCVEGSLTLASACCRLDRLSVSDRLPGQRDRRRRRVSTGGRYIRQRASVE